VTVSALEQCPSLENFLHFHVEMALLWGILAVNFKFYSTNKTTSELWFGQEQEGILP